MIADVSGPIGRPTDSNLLELINALLHLGILYPYLLEICKVYISYGYKEFDQYKTDLNSLTKDFICKIIDTHAAYKRSDALSWALYMGIDYKITLPKSYISKIIQTSDPIPTLFAYLYSSKRGHSYGVKFPDKEQDTSWWLYSYEKHRLNGTKFKNDSEDNIFLNRLLEENISFLNKEVR